MKEVTIHIRKEDELLQFLSLNGFEVENLGDDVWRVARDDELPVFMSVSEQSVYFEVDLGDISAIASQSLYFKLLDLNTEILPVSFGINSTNPDDPRLVLLESREVGNLDDHEILSVFDALELAVDRAEGFLTGELAEEN